VIGMIDLTLLTDLDEEQRDNLFTAKSCADSLLNIINDILDFSKIEAGKMQIQKTPFNLNEIIDSCIKIHEIKCKEKKLKFECSISEEIPQNLVGAPNRIQQVLNNLLSNAVKFTESGSVSLDIKVIEKKQDMIIVEFVVIDTGIGIKSEDLGKLFKSFTQVDGSHTRRFGGTGLGLVISKQLVE
ncbi:MAG: ATP-binding protein, partial [Spirochaetes bacterium]|nr:ATP-binding protein [Spirochaetota bacterium]